MGFAYPSIRFEFSRESKPCYTTHNPSFFVSLGWVHKFFTRHKLALRVCTSISHRWSTLIKFYANAARFMSVGKYPFSFVGNMNETPGFFYIVSSKYVTIKSDRECVVHSSGRKRNIWQLYCHRRYLNAPASDQLYQLIVPQSVNTWMFS